MDNKKFSEMLRKAATESQPSPAGSSGGTGGTSRFRQMLEAATTERNPFPAVVNPISASGKDTAKKRNKPNQLTDRERQQQRSRGLAMEKLLRDTANNPDAKLNVGADYYISRYENAQKARWTSKEKIDAYGKIGSNVDVRPSGDGMDDIRGYYYGEDREEERAKIRDWLTGKGYDGIVNQMRQYDDLYRGRDTAARNYSNAEDFERASAARNAEQYNGDAILNYVNALNSGSEHGESPVNDLLALSKRYDAGTLPELHGGAWGTDDPYAYILSNDTRADLHHLSADEEQMYYYILNKQGAGAARDYLDSIASLTNMRAQQAQADKVSRMNGWEAALYSAASVPARALGSIWSTADKIEQLGQGKIGYSRNQALTNLSDAIRAETAGRLDEATGGANLFGFGAGDVYQSLMSGADSAFGAGAFGQAYTALMGLGAASAEAEKLTRAGASEGQIIAGALTAGAAETVFEYASIEHLIKMRDPQTIAQAVKNALVQGGIEASEEVFTELSNMITNGIIMGSQSDFEQGIQALMAQGKSRAAATAEYIASSLYEAGMGGFISGGAAGGSTVAGAVLDNAGQTRQIGNAIRSTEGGVDALKELAKQVAEKNVNRQERGISRQAERTEKKTTDRNVGKLSNKIDRYRATQNRGDIAKALQEKGGLSEIRAVSAAQTVSDVLDGNADELTQERFEKLMENEKVAAAVNELWSPTSSVAVRNRSHTLTRKGESAEGVAEINNAIEAITKDTGEEADAQKAMEKAQESYETSSDGETFLKGTGLKADGMKIVGRENGQLMVEVQTEEGTQIVPASEISYASEEQAKIYGTLDLGGIDAESAQAIAQSYTSGTNVDNYLMGTDLAYRNGKYNLREGMEQVAELIGTEAAENAWQRGRITALEASRAQSTTTGKKTGGVSYEGDRSDYSALSDVQSASVKVLDKLGKALGINYHLYKSYVKDGKRVYEHNGEVVTAPNGYFVTESGEIYIDINAGDNGEGVILWTAAHEMVHDMRRNNAEGFDKLADFLFAAIEKDGASVHDLALEHMVRDKSLTEEAAMEEAVADAMQEMLTREDAAEQVRKLKTEDKGLWRKLRDVFKDLAKKLHALYQQFAPQSHEAQIVRQMEQAVQDRLAELFYEGVATAAENRNAEAKTAEAEKNTTEDGGVKLSARSDQQLDADYMAAVNAGDMETVQRMVDDAAKEWGAVLDDDDKPLRLYHSTNDEFYRFFRNKLGGNTSVNAREVHYAATAYVGFWLNDHDLSSKLNTTGKPIKAYVRGRMYYPGSLEGLANEIVGWEYDEAQEKFDNGSKSIAKKLGSEYRQKLEWRKYDGVEIEDEEMGGTSFCIFDSNDIKSAEPITRDANGNVIPLSKRFSEKSDIRYSQRGGAVTTRDMLTLMDAETVKNADEKRRLVEYQEKAAAYDEQQYIIATLAEDLREIRRGKGKRNMDVVRDMQAEISKAENRANLYAGQMARLENGTFIQRILNRNLREQNGVAAAKEAELNRTAEQLRRENQRLQTELYSSKVEALAESALMEQEFNDQLRATKEDYQERSKKKAAEVNERIQKLREEFRSRRAKELQERREKYENSLREMREGFKERSKQRTAEFNERLQRVREGYQESRKRDVEKRGNTVIRHKIAKLEKDLRNQLLKPSEGHYVPKELVGSTIDLLNAINMDSGRSERVAEKIAMIRSKYDAMKSDEKYAMYHDQVFSDALQKLVESIGDTSVAKMDRKQLEDVYDIMKAMHKTIRDAVKVTIGKEEYNAYQLAKQATNETMAVKTKDSLAAHWVGKQLRAETAFERFGGFAKNSAWSKLAKLLNDGQLKQTQITMEASQIFAELVNDKQAKTLLDTGDKATVDIGLKDQDGNAVKITRGMMLSIYMHLQNDQNARHLALGGLTLPGIKAYYKGDMGKAWGADHGFIPGITATTGASSIAEMQKLKKQIKEEKDKDKKKQLKKQYENASEALVFAVDEYTNRLSAAIEKQLTEYDRKWISAAKEFFDGYSRRVLNEATEEMYHFSKAKVQDYYPIRTDPNYRQASFESITRDMSLENSGFMKERVAGARNPILLEDITDVINGQVRRVAAYAGLAPAIRSFGKVYGKTMKNYENSLQNALASKFGKEGKDYVENLLADLTGSRRSEGTIFDALRGNMAGATLSLNPRVALAQAASFPTAAAELGVAPLAKALAKGGKNGWMFSAADRELISRYSPLLWYRMQGYRDTEIGDLKASQQFMAQANKKLRWALGWIQAMDGATVGRLWYAAQYYVDDHFGELEKGSDAYYQKVAEVFNRVVEKTQPNYTVMQRPDILRNPNALVKQLTMFMTQRLQNFNIVYEGLGRWKKYSADYKYGRNDVTRADLAEARNTALRSVGSQVAAAATIAAFKLLADALTHSLGAYRDDDKELTGSSIVLELVNIFTDSIISSTLWGSEFAGAVKYAIAKAKGESASFDMISIAGIENLESTLQSIIDSSTGMKNLFDPDKREGQLTAIEKTAFALSQAFGLPTKNLKKLLRGAWDTASEALNGDAWQSHGVKRTRAQNKNLLYKFMATGQTEEAEKIAATFDTDKKLHDAIREALREHDDRITYAAYAFAMGDIERYLDTVGEIENENHFVHDDIIGAIGSMKGSLESAAEAYAISDNKKYRDAVNNIAKSCNLDHNEVEEMVQAIATTVEPVEEKTEASKPAPGTAEDVMDAITSGQKGAADKLMNEIVKYKVDGGKTEDEAKKSLTQSISTSIKDRTEIGTLTAEQAADLLVSYCGVDQAAAMTKARYWRFDATSVYDWSQNEFEDYDEIKNKGISEAEFDQFLSATRGITSIEGGATKKEQILAAINKMPLTVAQKDALYYLKGYAESKIAETPWH